MRAPDPQQSGKATPSNPTPGPGYTQAQVDASLAANPNASRGGYEGPPMPPQYSTAPTSDWTSDPIYQLALGQNETAVKNAMSAALTSRIQALIAYGDPNLAFAVTGDQNVAAAAAANKGSTLAQLVASNAKTVRDTNEAENQNNLFYSSDRGYQLGLAQQAYLNNASGALSDVQGRLGSIGANLLAQQQGAYANEMQAASEAYNRAVANPVGLPTSTPPPTTTTTTPPAPPAPNSIPAVAKKAGAAANSVSSALSALPHATSILANKTGASANKTQRVFAVH